MALFIGNMVMIGDLAVGKTQILNQLNGCSFDFKYDPTMGADLRTIGKKIQNTQYRMKVWELTGEGKMRDHIKRKDELYEGDAGIVVVYDVTDRKTFDNLKDWIEIAMFRAKYGNKSIVIVGNKCDLGSKRQVSTDEGQQYADDLNLKFMEISAFDRYNIDMLSDHLLTFGMIAKSFKDEKKLQHIEVCNLINPTLKKKASCWCDIL